MKKIIALACSIFLSIGLLFYFQNHYEDLISKKYYDKFGDNLTANKFKSIALQNMGIREGDNLLMFGSSEFENNTAYPTHPIKFFSNKRGGFQINLIGKAGYKCLVHATDLGALGKSLKGQNVVFVLSPQWFTPNGISENNFEANSSELQVYGFLFNKDITLATKEGFSKRVIKITYKKGNNHFAIMREFCSLYSKNDFVSKAKRYLMTPYYWIRYELLTLKDDINSNKYLKPTHKLAIYNKPQAVDINWTNKLNEASKTSKAMSSNNRFGMVNKAYNLLIKGNLKTKKGFMNNDSYKVSPEYEDFKLLLDICKEEGIKPLILNIPVNGIWYDYAEFSKSDRLAYYKKINTMVNSYGFEVADFSKYEYKKYFLMDDEHIGWKGWVYIDKTIDKYYNENKK